MIVAAFLGLLGLLGCLQVALALGAPLGRYVWGGQHPRVLPTHLRVGSALAPVIYLAIAVLALDRSDVTDLVPDRVSVVGMWVVVALLGASVPANALSPSRHERAVMTPVSLALAGLAVVLAV